MLRCIRCAACMNHCPVYGAVGGHAYGWVYPGPMGAVLTPGADRRRPGRPPAQRLHVLRQVRERLPGEYPAAEPDAPLARTRVRAASDAGHDALRSGALGIFRPPAVAVPIGDARRRADVWACSAASAAASARCRSPAAGPRGATCRRPRATLSSPATRRSNGPGASDERETILNAIRRGLRRGPLPPDQAAMLRGRLGSIRGI